MVQSNTKLKISQKRLERNKDIKNIWLAIVFSIFHIGNKFILVQIRDMIPVLFVNYCRSDDSYPSDQKSSTQCWSNAGPASTMSAQQ